MQPPAIEPTPAGSDIQAELSRILSSNTFATRGRSRDFLRFVVEAATGGRRSTIKGYTIGVAVCRRPADFDPQSDAIVRVEAGRLRKRLAHYYLTEGLEDPVLIRIPTGTYVPEFSYRADAKKPVVEDVARRPQPPAPVNAASVVGAWARHHPPMVSPVAVLVLIAILLVPLGLVASHINRKLDHVLDQQDKLTRAIAAASALSVTVPAPLPATAWAPRRANPRHDDQESEAHTVGFSAFGAP